MQPTKQATQRSSGFALGLGAWEPSTPKESLMGSVEWKKTYDAVCQAISGTKTIKNKVVMGWHEAMLAKLAKMAKLAKNRRTNKRKRNLNFD